MHRQRSFSYCPECGARALRFDGVKRYSCPNCDLVFYQNTAAACGAILTVGDRILLLRRGKAPQKGLLDFPGGFVEPGEGLEAGLRREIREEIGLEPASLAYLTSGPNEYTYRGVTYSTCDVVFTGSLDRVPEEIEEGEIEEVLLLSLNEVELEKIAFPSLRDALALYLDQSGGWPTGRRP